MSRGYNIGRKKDIVSWWEEVGGIVVLFFGMLVNIEKNICMDGYFLKINKR